MWWKWREDGSEEFFDAPGEPNSREQGPQLNHFRSINIRTICKNLEETWEGCTCDPDQLPLYKMRDRDGKLIYLRESLSKEKLEESYEPEDPQPFHHVQVSFPECDENIHCEDQENTDKSTQIMPEDQDVSNNHQGDTTLEVILEDQRQDFEIAETINSEECEDMDPGLGVSQDNVLPSKITMDNTDIQETVNTKNECFVEPSEKKGKIQLHSTDRESQSKTAKVLEIVLGRASDISRGRGAANFK